MNAVFVGNRFVALVAMWMFGLLGSASVAGMKSQLWLLNEESSASRFGQLFASPLLGRSVSYRF